MNHSLLEQKIRQRKLELESQYSEGYLHGEYAIPLIADFVIFGLLLWAAIGGVPAALATASLWIFIGTGIGVGSFIGQLIHRYRTKLRGRPMVVGPISLLFYGLIDKYMKHDLFREIQKRTRTQEDSTDLELFQLCKAASTAPQQVREQQRLLFSMLNSDHELRRTERGVEKAINDTEDAMKKLRPFASSFGVEDLVTKLELQKGRLEARKAELQTTQETLEQEMTGTKQQFDQLNRARLALDSLKLLESNELLLTASEETMRNARQVCSLWDSRTASLELDTKSLIHSIPEAKEVYHGVIP